MSKRTVAHHLDTTLAPLFDGPNTAKATGISPVDLLRLEAQGLVVRRNIVKTGQRGRPAIVWALSKTARDKMRRQRAKQAA